MKSPKVVAIIQARLGSSRLPLKSLLTLHGRPVIDWVTSRVARARNLSEFIVAIPDISLDAALAAHLRNQGIPCLMGEENDVLARFMAAAKKTDADQIVRICADNPLIWGEAIDRLVDFYAAGDADYAYNHVPKGNLWPDGLGAEIISRELLEEMAAKAKEPSQREHCLNYIWDNASNFRIATFNPVEHWLRRPDLKLDLDSVEDYSRLARASLNIDMDAAAIVAAMEAANNPPDKTIN